MAITTVTKSHLHWNYFIALENDLAQVSRYVEFHDDNLDVFSIELAHLLLSAASEVDVMAKCVCKQVESTAKPGNINDYCRILLDAAKRSQILDVTTIKALVPRYGLSFAPWEYWTETKSPEWWGSYNKVKHERNKHFNKATLRHTLNAMGALLILNYIYYRKEFNLDDGPVGIAASGVFKMLSPSPSLISLPNDLPVRKGGSILKRLKEPLV